MSNMSSELGEMEYEFNDEQRVHIVIYSLLNDWDLIKMGLARTKYIVTLKHIRRRVQLEEEWQKAT